VVSYYKQIQNSIDYIESHLNEKISHEDLSSVSGYSVAHFYRIFKAMVGWSVMDYVRKRRLSKAVYALMTSSSSILEIALDNGYDSHEGFSRAFKIAYKAPPSHFRQVQRDIELFEQVNLMTHKKEGNNKMIKPEIIYKDRMYLVGKKALVTGIEAEKFALFRKTKDLLLDSLNQIPMRKHNKFVVTYDMDLNELDKSHDDMTYTYYYCVEVEAINDLPEGMVTKTLEPSKYAVFNYDKSKKLLNNEKIDRPIYDYINGVWLPDSGYELNDLKDFEWIDVNNNTVDYYISIK
jgi:AraC family transcriptional regulator